MDYTLNIFGPEANLAGPTPDKSDLAKRAGMPKTSGQKPIIVQILESFMSGAKGAPAPYAPAAEKKNQFDMPKITEPAKRQANDFDFEKVESNYDDDFSLQSSDKGGKDSPDQQEESVQSRLNAADKMVKDSLREETTGYGLDNNKPKTDFFAKAAEKKPIEKEVSAKSSE